MGQNALILRGALPAAVACALLLAGCNPGESVQAFHGADAWTSHGVETDYDLDDVAWDGRLAVAVGEEGFFTSPDGVTWTQRGDTLPDPGPQSVAGNGTLWVAMGNGNGAFWTSPDGIAWTRRDLDSAYDINAVSWTGDQWIAVGDRALILASPDGVTWTHRGATGIDPTSYYSLNAVVRAGNRLVVSGDNGLASDDGGLTWKAWGGSPPNTFFALAWSGKIFAGAGRFTMYTSRDGSAWAKHPVDDDMFSVIWTGRGFVATGYDGVIWTAPAAGAPWTRQNSGTTANLRSTAWTGTRVIAVGSGHAILTSP